MLCRKFCSSSREATSVPFRILFDLQRNGYTDDTRRIKHYHSCQNPLATVQGIDYINCRFVWWNISVAYRNILFKVFTVPPTISCERKHNTITTKPILLLFLFTKKVNHKAEHDNEDNKQIFSFTDKGTNIRAVSVVSYTRPLVSYTRNCRSVSYSHGY